MILPLVVQFFVVTAIAFTFRKGIPLRVNILLSSAFLTTPVWTYRPLADVGMIFLFDLVVPALIICELLSGRFRFNPVSTGLVGLLIVGLPLLFAPLSFVFLDPTYAQYHSVILISLLYRLLLLYAAVVVFSRDLAFCDTTAVIRLAAFQSVVLFAIGVTQYVGGIDLVIYERIKDTENAVEGLLGGAQPVFFGFGFLGLFRGAVAQMAIIGLFWCVLATSDVRRSRQTGLLLLTMCVLALVCVGGSLSRIGLFAVVVAFSYTAIIYKTQRRYLALLLPGALLFLYMNPTVVSMYMSGFDFIIDRFDVEQLTGQTGSGGTRISSAAALLEDLGESPRPWLVGLGGYNPITTEDRYGVFGMHGDTFDIVVRYGVIVGIGYLLALGWIVFGQLRGFLSDSAAHRQLPRAFLLLAIGIFLLSLTQGALLFSGAAGYLAAVHAWLAISFCMVVSRQRHAR